MKKVILLLSLIGCFCLTSQAGEDESLYQKIQISSYVATALPSLTTPPLILLNFPGAGKRNCLTDISVSCTNFPTNFSLFVLDGQQGTTAYAITKTTDVVIEDWYRGNPLCLSPGVTTYVYISSGNYSVNASLMVK